LGAWSRARDFELFGGHVDGDLGEEWSGEVALAGVGQHAEDGGSFWGLCGYAKCSGKGGSGADAYEYAFLLCEFLAVAHCFGVGDAKDLVDAVRVDGVLRKLGDEVGAPALLGMRGPGGVNRRGYAAVRRRSKPWERHRVRKE
jgi:hypothetical protein